MWRTAPAAAQRSASIGTPSVLAWLQDQADVEDVNRWGLREQALLVISRPLTVQKGPSDTVQHLPLCE